MSEKKAAIRLNEDTQNTSFVKVTSYENGHLDILNVVEDNKGKFHELSIHIDDEQALALYDFLKNLLN